MYNTPISRGNVSIIFVESIHSRSTDELQELRLLPQNFANGWVREVFSKTFGKKWPLNREGKVEEAIVVLFVHVFASHGFKSDRSLIFIFKVLYIHYNVSFLG